MRRIVLAGLLILIGMPAIAAPDREMAACAATKDGVKRLACYDDLAKKRGAVAETTTTGAGKWTYSEKVSKIDDSVNAYLYVNSTEKVAGQIGKVQPSLYITCREKKTSLYFNFDRFITTGYAHPTIRIDREKARDYTMSVSTSNEAFGLWSGKKAIRFIKKLFGKDRLLVRVTPYGASAVTAEFEIGGLEAAIKPLRTACGW